MNIELRKKARNDFVKVFFKLMNNSAFGKSNNLENARNYRNLILWQLKEDEISLRQIIIIIQQNICQKNS